MTRIRQLVRDGDKGAALPLVAGILVVLLGLSAFAVDLAWFYLNASRIQRAADAGALAGVIRMPDDFGQATTDARATARANGYQHGSSAVMVAPAEVIDQPSQLDVAVTDTVDTFFAKVFGMNEVTIARSARAEFIPPLPLGSPSNQFGNSCDPGQSGCGGQPNFWANIHGKWTARSQGDAYGTACASGNDNPSCTVNPLYNPVGYLYGIEANGASSFTISFVDLAFHNISKASEPCPGNKDLDDFPDGCTSDWMRTGDRGCEDWGPNSSTGCGPTMRISLYEPDPDPLDLSNNQLICSTTVAPRPQVAAADPYLTEIHKPCFQNVAAGPGIYVLQVQMVDPGGVVNRSGLNRYSLQSSPGTSLFALDRMSIYNNASGSTTEFHLAEVRDLYRGKTFVVELFDPGEGASGNLEMIAPDGQPFDDGPCRIYSRNNPTVDWSAPATPSSCVEEVSKDEYNDRWVKFEMDLPSDYACGSDCWWKVNYDYSGGLPNDTTTWRAYIFGNPIHLVPMG